MRWSRRELKIARRSEKTKVHRLNHPSKHNPYQQFVPEGIQWIRENVPDVHVGGKMKYIYPLLEAYCIRRYNSVYKTPAF